MIVLDTNVLSELIKVEGSPSVLGWISRFPLRSLFTTTISQAEILSGIAMMPLGRKRSGLTTAALRMLNEDFGSRILPFDGEAVPHYADIVADRRRSGRSASALDAMIVAIARSRGADVATRNTSHFENCGVRLHDPWLG